MKKQKIKLPGLRVKSKLVSTWEQIKMKLKKEDGGYTWVG